MALAARKAKSRRLKQARLYAYRFASKFRQKRSTSKVPAEQANRRRVDADQQRQRLDKWRERMRSGDTKTISKWLHHKENPHTSVTITHNDGVADNNVDAARFIYRHWQRLWDEKIVLDPAATAATMTNSFGDLQQQLQLDWQPLNLRTFSQALWDANGAAGCDSWSSQETKYMLLDAVRHLVKLTLRWYAAFQKL